jgi:hypothetical protein
MSSTRNRWHQMVSNQIPQPISGLFGCVGAAASVADGRKDSADVLSRLHPSDSVLTVSMFGMRWMDTRSTDITPDVVIETATDAGRRGSEGKGAEGNSAERYEGKQPTLVNKLDSRSQVPVNGRRKGRG